MSFIRYPSWSGLSFNCLPNRDNSDQVKTNFPVSASGAASILMFSVALSGLYPLFPRVTIVLGVAFLPLGCVALVVAILTELGYKSKSSHKARDDIQLEREPR
jgi:hypothetical protein